MGEYRERARARKVGLFATPSEVEPVASAWLVAGYRPEVHEAAKARLRREWPALADALDGLARVGGR